MAIPPTIPTSFVPKQPVDTTGPRRVREGTSLFLVIGLVIAAIAILGAGVTFGYQKYLENVRTNKSNQLADEEKQINQDTVEGFIHLQNRLVAANTLLDQHVVLSNFFDVLERITLQNVRFNSLHVLVNPDRTAQIQMSGTAKSFNALAAQSSAFAGEKNIRSAIFSGIHVNTENNTVSFSITATLDPKLLAFSVDDDSAAPVQTTQASPTQTQTQTTPLATGTSTASTTGL